jgi:hypothetical protein
MYGTYLRPRIAVHDASRAVVRAAARKLTPHARGDPARRAARYRFYRQMLACHQAAQQLVRRWRL